MTMKYLRGFLMAWGNFSALPCPYKGWHEEARKAMLCMLPLVGIMLSVVILAVWALLDHIGMPPILTGAGVTALYFCCNGFIHLDGFMDCSDAILSRRPNLAERQRILKTSDVGAFAVISVVLMLLLFSAAMTTLAVDFSLWKELFFAGVTITSRAVAADAVLGKPAMGTSQYASMKRRNGEKWTKEMAVLWGAALLPLLLLFFLMIGCGAGNSAEAAEALYICGGAVVVTAFTAHITGFRDRKKLGGMNGDIAGHMIVTSETVGVLAAAVLASGIGTM